jgi:ribosomal biogenesis protein LAS1
MALIRSVSQCIYYARTQLTNVRNRFVNTIVDPLQTTYFARSIASLAAQLGLPLWFVELRHAATHEDLPSISVLRDASRQVRFSPPSPFPRLTLDVQALDWLYTNYWLPTISPSSSPVALLPLDPLRTLLKSYKLLTKTTLRDSSKLTRSKAEFLKVYKGIDKWITEASGLGRGRERALEGLVEALVEVGALVPLAKKKRPTARNMELGEGGEIWGELLGRLEETYEGFADLLVGRLVELLCLVVIPGEYHPATMRKHTDAIE